MSQVHDNIITAYQIDFENEQLTIKTDYYYDGKLSEKTDIVFSGYLTHMFNNEIKNSILFDVEEQPLSFFLEKEHELLEDNRCYGWPINYKTTDAHTELTEFMQKNEYKVFEISSSYGLYGWVLAKQMKIVVSDEYYKRPK